MSHVLLWEFANNRHKGFLGCLTINEKSSIIFLVSTIRSYTACRENEKCQDQLLDCKLGRGKVLSEKEHVKLESKRKKSESAVRKCDMEYYAAAIKSERSR